ncbi:transposase [Bacillus shivajii]|uniref:transposase n=1 Tax=Bacillus shivajii TaxID=1983719 RepID=UPI001CFB6BB9|nr:transposase [Bacillus shivajii]UCZ53035.1 transposase [Bacillus shivajii]
MSGNRNWKDHLFYHVYSRGNRKETLFRDVDDYIFFQELLSKTQVKYPFELIAYCLMNNHYHLEIRSFKHSLSKIMEHINKLYARYFNRKYNLTGHVFERRFQAKPIYQKRGLLIVSRYIHYNPVEANLCETPKDYRWSSFSHYYPELRSTLIDEKQHPIINTTPILSQFPGDEGEQKQTYIEWCKY